MDKLKPCPFCGSGRTHILESKRYYVVACKSCCAEGPPSGTINGAFKEWDKTTDYADLESENAALEKRCAELDRRNEVFTEYIHGYVEDIGDAEDRADRLAVIADALAVESWQNYCHSCNQPMSNYCPRCKHLWET